MRYAFTITLIWLGLMSAFAQDGKKDCGALDGSCTPPDPVIGEQASGDICRWVKEHRSKEHIIAMVHDKVHCELLGGDYEGFGKCYAKGGPLSIGPNLRGFLGAERISTAARTCAAAAGVPAQMLVEYWDAKTTFHMGLCKWAGYPWPNSFPHGFAADATSGVPGQDDVPAACLNWHL